MQTAPEGQGDDGFNDLQLLCKEIPMLGPPTHSSEGLRPTTKGHLAGQMASAAWPSDGESGNLDL